MTLYIDITRGKNDPKPERTGPSGRGSATRDAEETDWSKPWVHPNFEKEFEGMSSDAPSTEDEFKDYYEQKAPEAQALESIKQDIDAENEQKVKDDARALYNSVGQNGEGPAEQDYDYEGLVRSGGAVASEEGGGVTLPNAHLKKNKVEIYGYDLSTGDQVRERIPDPDGLVKEAVQQLHGSQTNTKVGPPIEDTSALTKLGVAHIRNGGGYDEFKANLPGSFTDEQKQMAYRVADDYVKREDFVKLLESDSIPAPQDAPLPSWDLTDADLQSNDLWMNSARVMYRALEGEEFQGEDSELYDLSLEMMAQFNWNASKMAYYTYQVMNGQDDVKRAMYAMMKMYENKDTTGGDVLNNLLSLGTDPFSYLTLGFGKVGLKAAQVAASKEISKRLGMYVAAGSAGAGEGAVFTGFDDFSKQMVEVEAGAKKKYDAAQTATAAAAGAAAGTVLGPAFVFGGEKAVNYGKDLVSRVKEMRQNPDPRRVGPLARQSGRIGFEPTANDIMGEGVSSVGIIDLPEPPFVPDPNSFQSPNKQVGNWLQERADNALQGRVLTENTTENKEFLSDVMVHEALAQMLKDKKHGLDDAAKWYKETLDEARGLLGTKWPEIVKDTRHRSAFDFALAITSNGQKVDDNMKYATSAYQYWREEGRMPTAANYGKGKEANAMVKSFQTYNHLLDAWGEEALLKNLATEFRVGDMKAAGFNIADEGVDAMLPLSVIFGSKIGGGFYSNLQGDWNRLTPDRWFARTWGRITGTMVTPNEKLAKKHYDDFVKNYVAGKPTIVKYLGSAPRKSDLTPELVDELGQRIYAKWQRAKGPNGESFPDKGNPMHTLSRAIDNRLAPREGPRGSKERQMMRETVDMAVKKLQAQGHADLTMSGLQAILWYPEQRLWDQLGSKQTGKENNYAKAARKYLGLPADADGGRGVGGDGQAGREPSLEGRDPGRFIAREVARNLRVGPRGQHSQGSPGNVYQVSGGGSKSLLIGGAKVPVAATHAPRKNRLHAKDPRAIPASALETAGVTTEPWHEVASGSAGDAAFHKAISASKDSSGKNGAAVYIYDIAGENSLEGSTKFLTGDGKAGFAIKPDGDIVSVFNSSDRPQSALSALMLAVENGGTKLDAFDTILPYIYAQAGFKVVRREKWNEVYKPPGWDKNYFKKKGYSGTPDIVYMEYDPQSHGIYSKGDGEYSAE